MKPKLLELRKEFEELVGNGILNEGFIVNCFHFSVPEEIEKFFDTVVDEISIFETFLEVWISDRRQAIFTISYRNYFSSEKRSYGLNKYEDDFGDYDPTKYPVIYAGFGVHFETYNLSTTSLDMIEKHKNLFNDFNKNEVYFSLYFLIEDFDLDFDYYGEVL
jgi:hypothetical protein